MSDRADTAQSASPEAMDSAYQRSRSQQWLSLGRVAALACVPLILGGALLDWFVYPDQFWQFFVARLATSGFILLAWLAYHTGIGGRLAAWITWSWLVAVQLMIAGMIALTEGAHSPYYAGLNLALLAVGVALPAVTAEAVGFALVSLAIYASAVMVHGFEGLQWPLLVNNVFFLLVTTLVMLIATFFSAQHRYEQFRLRYELAQRNAELTELDRLKSQFFANISHELRTPLTLILGPIDRLLMESVRVPDRVASMLRVSRDNGFRLLKLVDDLLDVIRLESVRSTPSTEAVECALLVRQCAHSVSQLALSKGVAIDASINEEGLWVAGDRSGLEKVFLNLLSNAVKFTPEGGEVRVRAWRGAQQVMVSVTDDGIGISQENLPFIFDRFRQGDGSATRRFTGTGLGLALVRDITRQHGGEVSVDSRLNEGTCFTVELPLAVTLSEQGGGDEPQSEPGEDDALELLHHKAQQTAAMPMELAEELEVETGFVDERAQVLVVDDEPDMRRYLVDVLSEDYQVLKASDGEAGERLAKQSRPDLIVLDMMLPGKDGVSVCRALREDSALDDCKILLLTARAEESVKIDALRAGADDFLTKPFSTVEVLTRLENLAKAASLQRELRDNNRRLEQALEDLHRTQGQLIQSEKINALGSLAAGLLHEVNNPLNFTHAALQLARQSPLVNEDEDMAEICGDMQEGLERVQAIVKDLRAFAYPSDAQRHARFDLADALRAALSFTAAELRSVEVNNQVPAQTWVNGSHSHVVQVLVNLLTNAAKAMSHDSDRQGLIEIACESQEKRVLLQVRDNGRGMDEETLAKVFDPFFTTRDVGEGMGLGLSICHTIVETHGGQLRASSVLGEGSCFEFDLERNFDA